MSALCPRCSYCIEHVPGLERCPECGLELGNDFIAFGARRSYRLVDWLFNMLAVPLLVVGWIGVATSSRYWAWATAVPFAIATVGMVSRLRRFSRYSNPEEFLILNTSTIRWSIAGRRDVTLNWKEISNIVSVRWCDWIILIVSGRPRFVPARFRPVDVNIGEFASMIRAWWSQHQSGLMDRGDPR